MAARCSREVQCLAVQSAAGGSMEEKITPGQSLRETPFQFAEYWNHFLLTRLS